MTCFSPLKGYRSAERSETGKRPIVFNPVKALIEGSALVLPCGQCIGCRTGKAKEWAIRCAHEAAMADRSCFITLTYAPEHVPQSGSVSKRDWQLFMMRLRKQFGAGIRFFACGEYGEDGGRPHYHAVLFGHDFDDKRRWCVRNGYPVWKSEALERLWPFGLCEVGSVTAQSAGYVARYCLKKFTGELADEHYSRVSPVDGQVYRVEPEFALMSRRPGLGTSWFVKFSTDAFPSDFLIVDGRKVRPPGFYLRRLVEAEQAPIKRRRKAFAVKPAQRANATSARLAVREEVFRSRMNRLVRSL